MAIVLSGTTNDILVNGVSVATDAEVSSTVATAVQTGLVALQTIATGKANFTATTNNINLTGIGLGVEVGDVIQISGAHDAKNNSEFTIEVITDANNIIVNQAHANKGTTKNVATRASDTGVTVKLLSKWYNAPNGLGQDWVNVTTIRSYGTIYTNLSGREISVILDSSFTGSGSAALTINGSSLPAIFMQIGGGIFRATAAGAVTRGATYTGAGIALAAWFELR